MGGLLSCAGSTLAKMALWPGGGWVGASCIAPPTVAGASMAEWQISQAAHDAPCTCMPLLQGGWFASAPWQCAAAVCWAWLLSVCAAWTWWSCMAVALAAPEVMQCWGVAPNALVALPMAMAVPNMPLKSTMKIRQTNMARRMGK